MRRLGTACFIGGLVCLSAARWQASVAQAAGDWEFTAESEQASVLGLQWLDRNQGPDGNWESDDLGLVSMGALAFLAAGHMPDRGPYGETIRRALDYVINHAQPSGLLSNRQKRREMYNHGLSALVLAQAYGMTDDTRLGPTLDRALKLIADTQCEDGGWRYEAERQPQGNDLSLAVMQAMALRSAADSGLQIAPEMVRMAIEGVRRHYSPRHGQFTYQPEGRQPSIAMAAAGVVCLQEFGEYDDWRIPKSMEVVRRAVKALPPPQKGKRVGEVLQDAYTIYYVSQALHQVGGEYWQECYPLLRDSLVACQIVDPGNPRRHGMWYHGKYVSGLPGELYMTSAACFVLAIPNRFLPILQVVRKED